MALKLDWMISTRILILTCIYLPYKLEQGHLNFQSSISSSVIIYNSTHFLKLGWKLNDNISKAFRTVFWVPKHWIEVGYSNTYSTTQTLKYSKHWTKLYYHFIYYNNNNNNNNNDEYMWEFKPRTIALEHNLI